MRPRDRAQSSSKKVSTGTYARGVERRGLILEAALRVAAREGVGAVTHRSVAKEAGVSLRATTYYFETKQEMIREALRLFVQQNIARADAVAADFPSSKSKLDNAVDAVAGVMRQEIHDSQVTLCAEYELVLAIAREPEYAPEYQELERMLEVRLKALLAAIGSAAPLMHARLVLAASRGLLMQHLASPDKPLTERALRAHVRVLIEALVPGSAEASF